MFMGWPGVQEGWQDLPVGTQTCTIFLGLAHEDPYRRCTLVVKGFGVKFHKSDHLSTRVQQV